jgi:ribonuclease J
MNQNTNNNNNSPFKRVPYSPFGNNRNNQSRQNHYRRAPASAPILAKPEPAKSGAGNNIGPSAAAQTAQTGQSMQNMNSSAVNSPISNNTQDSGGISSAPKPYFLSSMKLKNSRRPMPRTNKSYTLPPRQTMNAQGQFQAAVVPALPPLAEGNIRIIPLGGVEEIGMNMTLVEIGNDIVVIDAGFKFKQVDTPGIDYIIPNTKYLEERKHKIRGIIITHGHLDHVGGIPFIMERIGNPPLYTRNLTSLMIKKRQAEFPHAQPIDFKVVESTEKLLLGNMHVKFFNVTHSIPDSLGIVIETPYGNIINPGDFKLTHVGGVIADEEEKAYNVFKDQKNLLLLGESTNIENPGFSTPEHVVHESLEEIIKSIHGRLVLGMFASHIHRIAKVVQVCEKYGKKLVIEGRSMKNNIDICVEAGVLTIQKGTVINAQDMTQYPPDKIVILATGAQGDEFAALMRMSTKNHKYVQIGPRDTILLSSSIIPGNEKDVDKLKDNFARLGARLIEYRTSDVFVHSTGHANRGEIEWLHRKINPKFFIPIHGNHYRLKMHADLAVQLGMPPENVIVPDDGSIVEIQDNGSKIVKLGVKAPDSTVMVDGFTIGDIQDVVIRDRQILAQEGFYVVVGLINAATGKLRKSPDIISRGSVYLRESQELLRESRILIKRTIERATEGMQPINIDYVKDVVSETLTKFIFQQTAKKPIIIPVIIPS